ncbi:formate hydrogenlyase complex 3 iron-sulfur protein [Klebsiella pneumoniae]|uniref:Formate hydrogenlyase complex 3 iron-sulfur protein n=1 Tax=Klebsiella pneumoniae TaxID=573 RepID=A0A2X1SM35_KLEPN|nr:formate hydrogenlyase complex 3 iron-sulfur protein [Klebsiella pneumoniae]
MFTFIKKVIKTGTETHAYPLEPMPVDKNFRGKPEHTPQQCIGCAACVNACPSNALTVEIDLATNQLAWQFNLGRCIFCGRCEEVCPTAAIKLSPEYELGGVEERGFPPAVALRYLPLPGVPASVRGAEGDRLRHRAAQA